ncbi:UNVERIFIED_CONTAM: hypothetical protein RMT77_015613 [Armadillidium vulgare]
MKNFNRKICIFLLIFLLFLLESCDSRRGGGGSRGGSSRGSSRGGGWFSSKSTSKSSSYSHGSKLYSGSMVNGRSVMGTYKAFGSPSRWSLSGRRSYYFVGYPYGHRHFGYGHYYGSSRDGGAEILNPWVIMILILLGVNLIGFSIWLAVYYIYK